MKYEEGEPSRGDKIPFEGDGVVGVLLKVSKLFFDSFAFDLMLKLVVYLDCLNKLR